MDRIKSFLTLVVILLPVTVNSVTVSNLYEAEVPINDISPESWGPAIRTALGIVLIRLTGDRYAAGNPVLQSVLSKANNYMTEYKPNADELVLWVRFDEAKLEKDIRNLGIPVWGKERPLTLVWIVIEGESGREILGMEGNQDFIEIIENRASRRGIVMSYPLLDLEDSANLQASDIRAGFMQTVLEASRRYPVDSILAGSIESPVPGIWESRWFAYINGENIKTWNAEGDIPGIVIDEGIDGLADFLAANFNQSQEIEQNNVSITIADIYNVDQYAEAYKYLDSLSAVINVYVSHVTGSEVTFIVEAHGGCRTVSQAIALGRKLEPLVNNECDKYRLLP